jgi:hypothetical protein
MFHAANNPVGVSLIYSYFENTEYLSRANSFVTFGNYFGVGFSSLTLLLDLSLGWRVTVLIVAGLGTSFALMILLMKEPYKS